MSPENTPPQRPLTRRELEARIVAKAWKNPAYARRLSADPKAVLQEELRALDPSIALPAALAVEVHHEDSDTFHLVVPRNPDDISLGEVLGGQMEAVAPQTIAVIVAANTTNVTIAGPLLQVVTMVGYNALFQQIATTNANANANVIVSVIGMLTAMADMATVVVANAVA